MHVHIQALQVIRYVDKDVGKTAQTATMLTFFADGGGCSKSIDAWRGIPHRFARDI
jgi:hypothetical protein